MPLDKSKEHWRIIDTDLVQFVVERGAKKPYEALICFYILNDSYCTHIDFDTKEDMDRFFETVGEEECMECYYSVQDTLN